MRFSQWHAKHPQGRIFRHSSLLTALKATAAARVG
jgi:hypothetical protein